MAGAALLTSLSVLTHRGQFVLHLQNDSLTNIFQEADNLIVSELGQVDAIHGTNIVAHIKLVTPAQTVKSLT